MTETLSAGNLVLYKNDPARLIQVGDKIAIELPDGKTLKVRPKDVELLHPGPVTDLADLVPSQEGEPLTAWELLAGETTDLTELATLIYGDYTPATAWATWQLITDGLYFRGTPLDIDVRSREQVARDEASRQQKANEEAAWQACLARLQTGQYLPADDPYLEDVVRLALEKQDQSRVLTELGRKQSPEHAHRFLLKLGYWSPNINPYPQRHDLMLQPPDLPIPPLPDEPRRDLTHLPAFAIDDTESTDPDDALSVEGNRLWVHVADVAAVVGPDSPLDLEARARSASLYLPEGVVTMLPPAATSLFALGLSDISPALSFGLDLQPNGSIAQVEIVPSWIKVTRLTYDEVETRLTEEPFRTFQAIAHRNRTRRLAQGAISLDLPEVKVRVKEEQVVIEPLPALQSRELVAEAMLLAGEGAARFALERNIPVAFSTQPPPESQPAFSEGLAGEFALRRTLQRSEMKSVPGPHAALGLPAYVQTTSPLRRYLDLVAHQQLRAYLRGDTLLDASEMLERVGAAAAVFGSIRGVERASRKHWTLVYLLQNQDWQGVGILVDKWKTRGRVLIPELALETVIQLSEDIPLNTEMVLQVKKVRLSRLDAFFKVVLDTDDQEEESLEADDDDDDDDDETEE